MHSMFAKGSVLNSLHTVNLLVRSAVLFLSDISFCDSPIPLTPALTAPNVVPASAQSCRVRSEDVVTDRHPHPVGKGVGEIYWLIITATPAALLCSCTLCQPGVLNRAALFLPLSTGSQHLRSLLFSTSSYAAQALRSILVFLAFWQATRSKAHLASLSSHSPKENSFLFAHNMSLGERHSPVGGYLAAH